MEYDYRTNDIVSFDFKSMVITQRRINTRRTLTIVTSKFISYRIQKLFFQFKVYIGIAADIIEFFEVFKEQKVDP